MMQVLLFLAVLPSMVLGFYIYKKDKIEKEPTSLLVKLLFAGVLSAIITLAVTFMIDIILPADIIGADESKMNVIELIIDAYITVALIEEGSKYLMVRAFTWNSKEFNHIFDAIVYTVFVSLGFATFENILYVIEGGFVTALMRAVLSVPGHVFFAIAMGTYYGRSKQASIVGNKSTKAKNDVLTILIPTLLHGTFDFCLLSGNGLLLLFYLGFVVALYIVSFKRVKRVADVQNNFAGTVQTPSINQYNPYQYNPNQVNTNQVQYTQRFCHNCGKQLEGNFCSFCGTKRL